MHNYSKKRKGRHLGRKSRRLFGGVAFTPTTKQQLKKAILEFYKNGGTVGHISTWDVSKVKDFSDLFNFSTDFDFISTFTGEGIENWNTSNVTDMSRMFYRCNKFNQPLNWNTSKVKNMQHMFDGCSDFNKPFGERWNTSKVKYMQHMFDGCRDFNQPLVWNTSKVENMAGMFRNCRNFNEPLNWNTSNVKNMAGMFDGCWDFKKPFDWDTSKVENMAGMFKDCREFNQSLGERWNTSNVKNMNRMFINCRVFNQPLDWDTSQVDTMTAMFSGCSSFNQSLDWNISRVFEFFDMFFDCTSLASPIHFTLSDENITRFPATELGLELGLTQEQKRFFFFRENENSEYINLLALEQGQRDVDIRQEILTAQGPRVQGHTAPQDIHEKFKKYIPIIPNLVDILKSRVQNDGQHEETWNDREKLFGYIFGNFTKTTTDSEFERKLQGILNKGLRSDTSVSLFDVKSEYGNTSLGNFIGWVNYYLFDENESTELRIQYITEVMDGCWSGYTELMGPKKGETEKEKKEREEINKARKERDAAGQSIACVGGIWEKMITAFLQLCILQCDGEGPDCVKGGKVEQIANLSRPYFLSFNDLAAVYSKLLEEKGETGSNEKFRAYLQEQFNYTPEDLKAKLEIHAPHFLKDSVNYFEGGRRRRRYTLRSNAKSKIMKARKTRKNK